MVNVLSENNHCYGVNQRNHIYIYTVGEKENRLVNVKAGGTYTVTTGLQGSVIIENVF
jgi:hypothetical protein